MRIDWKDSDGISTAQLGNVLLQIKQDGRGFALSIFVGERSHFEDELESDDLALAKQRLEAIFTEQFGEFIRWGRSIAGYERLGSVEDSGEPHETITSYRDCIRALLPDRHAIGRLAVGPDSENKSWRIIVSVPVRDNDREDVARSIAREMIEHVTHLIDAMKDRKDALAEEYDRALGDAVTITATWAVTNKIDAMKLVRALQGQMHCNQGPKQ